jgi:alpha-beta hydrolase superfamily lysophospholipase
VVNFQSFSCLVSYFFSICSCRGLIVLLHGLNEHSGRYSDFAKQLNANGFKVYGIDWIGK